MDLAACIRQDVENPLIFKGFFDLECCEKVIPGRKLGVILGFISRVQDYAEKWG